MKREKKSAKKAKASELPKIARLITKEQEELEKRLSPLLKATEFGKDGLRIIPAPLAREEFDFSAISPEEAQTMLFYEYTREVELRYKSDAFLIHPSNPTWWKGWQNQLRLSHFFPLPYQAIKSEYRPERKASPSSKEEPWLHPNEGLVAEWGTFEYVRHSTDELDHGYDAPPGVHYLRVDLRGGRGASKKAIGVWIDERTSKSQGKNWGQEIDRLNALAAWRAHRAGLNHLQFMMLKPNLALGVSYHDPSSYRTAWKRAEKDLKNLVVLKNLISS